MSKPITSGTLALDERRDQVPAPTSGSPDSMIVYAMRQGASINELKELYALQKQFEADQAKKAYTEAMAAFKCEPMEILKRKKVVFGDTKYFHAELSDITEVVVPAMAKHGLMHQWDVRQESGGVTVDCIITHQLGHSEKVTMSAAPDASGKKNPIQQIASAVQYLQRYTLLAATGMATKSMDDDDGQKAYAPAITDEQADTLDSLINDVGANKAAFLRYLKVDRLEDLPAAAYATAVQALEAKRRGGQ